MALSCFSQALHDQHVVQTVHLPTGRVVGYRGLGSTVVQDLDVEPGNGCTIEAPSAVEAVAAGGVVEVPVVAQGVCLPWMATSMPQLMPILNGGPHSSTTTLRMVLPPSDGPLREFFFSVAGLTGRVVQAGAAPSTPQVVAQVSGRRISLQWLPRVGAAPTEFGIRGAQRADPLTILATLPSDARTWTSPDLANGAYELDVVARNAAGESEPSERLQVTIDDTQRPNAPTQLTAESRDNVVYSDGSLRRAVPRPRGMLSRRHRHKVRHSSRRRRPRARPLSPRLFRVEAGKSGCARSRLAASAIPRILQYR